MDVEVIRSIPLSMERHDDEWAWHFEKKKMVPSRFVPHIACS
jgi:hypothetical protein